MIGGRPTSASVQVLVLATISVGGGWQAPVTPDRPGGDLRRASSYSELIARQRADLSDRLFAAVRRLRWSPERLAEERRRRLRAILEWSAARSPFYRERLAGVDVADIDESGLATLPPTTKQDLMEEFDRVVTDPALTAQLVDGHVDGMTTDAYLLGQYRTIATSGTSGRRGVFVYGWDDWLDFAVISTRWTVLRLPDEPASRVTASLFDRSPTHVSGALHAFFADPAHPVVHLPITMPLSDIVAGLNAAQPDEVIGYPSAVQVMAAEARAGRLSISPREIGTCGELLTDEVREGAREAWGVEISDVWGLSEGAYAFSCGVGRGMHLPDDLVIVEPVDGSGRPVAPGARADKVYLTNLYNRTQPLIRYEVTDAMSLREDACACGCAHRRIDRLEGRLDETLRYPSGVVVHPAGLCAAMVRHPAVAEYQVRQTPGGVAALVRTEGPGTLDADGLRADLRRTLLEAGLADPEASVAEVESFDRLRSGKARRIVPMGAAGPRP